MNDSFYRNAKWLPAFTIVESIISLTIVSMMTLLIAMVLHAIWQQQQTDNELTNFHLYLRTIESPQYHFKYIAHTKTQLKLSSHGKTYLIMQKHDGIRMTTAKGGYVPLLDRVEQVTWQYEHSNLFTRVQTDTGQTFKAVSLIEPGKDDK